MPALLSIEDLTVVAHRGGRNGASRTVLDRIALRVDTGRITGLAGESGSGKSMLAMSIAGLLPPGCAIANGRILWNGEDLAGAGERRLEALRGAQIAYVFQEPMTALNPTIRIGRQMIDVIRRHRGVDAATANARALELLAEVRIADPRAVLGQWPHQLSGGMRQRVLIAMAFSCEPALIVADEPTTALDVTIRAQILSLLTGLAREKNTAVLMITHDIGVLHSVCETVHILYAGRAVERGPAASVLESPRHPYTRGLLACLPERAAPRQQLRALGPSTGDLPGCVFRSRCDEAFAQCAEAPPMTTTDSPAHEAACWLTRVSA